MKTPAGRRDAGRAGGRRAEAEALGASLPALMLAAEQVAATVAQGLHGRRRVGMGEQFWQFRPFVAGDARSRIDWRRSARSDQIHLRETEWDAAQTLALWRDAGPGMHWRSDAALPTKHDRACLLLLALASLALRGGERVRLLEGEEANAAGLTGGTAALDRLGAALGRPPIAGLPQAMPPAHASLVLIGDFLAPVTALRELLGRCAALQLRGVLVQVLDPAELELPFSGRVRFSGLGDGAQVVLENVEAVRAAYAARLAAHRAEIAALAGSCGMHLLMHRTDEAPAAVLAALHGAVSA